MQLHRLLRLVLLLPVVTVLCCRREIPCSEASVILFYVSFPQAETDSIIVQSYIKNNRFDSLANTIMILKSNSTYHLSNDTLQILNEATGGDYVLDIGHDYEVYFPASNKVYKITGIEQRQTSINSGLSLDKRSCVNPVVSYAVNGQAINQASSNIIYIKN